MDRDLVWGKKSSIDLTKTKNGFETGHLSVMEHGCDIYDRT